MCLEGGFGERKRGPGVGMGGKLREGVSPMQPFLRLDAWFTVYLYDIHSRRMDNKKSRPLTHTVPILSSIKTTPPIHTFTHFENATRPR